MAVDCVLADGGVRSIFVSPFDVAARASAHDMLGWIRQGGTMWDALPGCVRCSLTVCACACAVLGGVVGLSWVAATCMVGAWCRACVMGGWLFVGLVTGVGRVAPTNNRSGVAYNHS